MQALEILLLVIGPGVMLVAYGRYLRRTRDVRAVLVFWSHKLALSRGEFRLQRAGIVLLLLGVVLRYLNILQPF